MSTALTSRAVKGSSNIQSVALRTARRASSTRRFWPADRKRTGRSSRPRRPKRARALSAAVSSSRLPSRPAAIGLALWLTRPELAVYAGLSGVVTGLAALLALCLMQRPGVERVWGGMLLVMILAKTGFDCVGRDALFARFDGEEIKVEPAAHLAGLAWAALFAATDAPWRRSRNRRECDRSLR